MRHKDSEIEQFEIFAEVNPEPDGNANAMTFN